MKTLVHKWAMITLTAVLLGGTSSTLMASSTNCLVQENIRVAEDTCFTDPNTAPKLSITFDTAQESGGGYADEIFYLGVINCKYNDEMFNSAWWSEYGITSIQKQSDTEAKIIIQPESRNRAYYIPILVDMESGAASLYLEGYGSMSTITEIPRPSSSSSSTKTEEETNGESTNNDSTQQDSLVTEKEEQAVSVKCEVKFSLGKKSYTYAGETREMSTGMYIKAPGYAMLPIRYAAEAIGVKGEDIEYEDGMTTFNVGDTKIVVQKDSQTIVVNGEKVEMAVCAEITEGRMCVPVGELAKILNIEVDWDEVSKTATFKIEK